MKKRQNKSKTDKGVPLLLSIILVFCVGGGGIFCVTKNIKRNVGGGNPKSE